MNFRPGVWAVACIVSGVHAVAGSAAHAGVAAAGTDEVTVVWPDDGAGLMRDEGRVQPGPGMYYHTAMLSDRGNQWSELVSPAERQGFYRSHLLTQARIHLGVVTMVEEFARAAVAWRIDDRATAAKAAERALAATETINDVLRAENFPLLHGRRQ